MYLQHQIIHMYMYLQHIHPHTHVNTNPHTHTYTRAHAQTQTHAHDAYDTAVQGARWSVMNSTLRTNAATLIVSLTNVGGSTVVGIPPGTYSPFILFPKFVILTINPDRTTYIRDVSADSITAQTLS